MADRCACASWEGTTPRFTPSFPTELFETVEYESLGDYHGAIAHRGRLRCRNCGATFSYESELSATVVTREPT